MDYILKNIVEEVNSLGYKIALLDDEWEQLRVLKLYLLEYFKQKNLIVEIIEFDSGIDLIEKFQQNQNFCDVLFLDVEMDSISGVEVAKKIRELNQDMFFIFVTSHAEFALTGFDVRALDYIMKPIQIKRLNSALNDLFIRLEMMNNQNQAKVLTVVLGRDTYMIPLQSIVYLVKDGNKVNIVCEINRYECYNTLNHLKEQLDEKQFIQCHQGYIVNKNWITANIQSKIQLKTGSVIPVSRKYAKEIKDVIMKK